jgi:hypothetical protein
MSERHGAGEGGDGRCRDGPRGKGKRDSPIRESCITSMVRAPRRVS